MDKPKITYYNNGNIKREQYYLNGKLHKIDGPAYITYYNSGAVKYEFWYINGNEIKNPPKKWPLTNEQQISLKLKYG